MSAASASPAGCCTMTVLGPAACLVRPVTLSATEYAHPECGGIGRVTLLHSGAAAVSKTE